jgi:hypothetical protein
MSTSTILFQLPQHDIAIAAIAIAATCRGGAGQTAPGGGCMMGHSNSFIVLCGCQQLFSPSESCWIGLPISRIQGDFAGGRNFRLMDAFLNKKAWRCGPAMGLWPLDLEPAGIGEAGWPRPQSALARVPLEGRLPLRCVRMMCVLVQGVAPLTGGWLDQGRASPSDFQPAPATEGC